MKTWGSGCITPCFLNFHFWRRSVVIFTPRVFYPKERWFGRGFSLGSGEDKRLLILPGIELLGRPARSDYTNCSIPVSRFWAEIPFIMKLLNESEQSRYLRNLPGQDWSTVFMKRRVLLWIWDSPETEVSSGPFRLELRTVDVVRYHNQGATKFCILAPNIWGFSVWDLHHFTPMTHRILRLLLEF